jgi:hypothetical protein
MLDAYGPLRCGLHLRPGTFRPAMAAFARNPTRYQHITALRIGNSTGIEQDEDEDDYDAYESDEYDSDDEEFHEFLATERKAFPALQSLSWLPSNRGVVMDNVLRLASRYSRLTSLTIPNPSIGLGIFSERCPSNLRPLAHVRSLTVTGHCESVGPAYFDDADEDGDELAQVQPLEVLRAFPNLERLSLFDRHAGNVDISVTELFQPCAALSKLTHLACGLFVRVWDNRDLAALGGRGGRPRLRSLALALTSCTEAPFASVLAAVARLTTLTALDLGADRVDDLGTGRATSLAALSSLQLGSLAVDAAMAPLDPLLQAAAAQPALTRLRLDGIGDHRGWGGGCSLGLGGARPLRALADTLQALDLAVVVDSAWDLFDGLRALTRVTELRLDCAAGEMDWSERDLGLAQLVGLRVLEVRENACGLSSTVLHSVGGLERLQHLELSSTHAAGSGGSEGSASCGSAYSDEVCSVFVEDEEVWQLLRLKAQLTRLVLREHDHVTPAAFVVFRQLECLQHLELEGIALERVEHYLLPLPPALRYLRLANRRRLLAPSGEVALTEAAERRECKLYLD